MPTTIGIHVGHDGGCAVCQDGEITVACAEERLSRIKYANGWWNSLRYCLDAASISLSDADLVVFSNSGEPLDEAFDGGLRAWGARRTATVDHHLSHAIGAFAFSAFNEALVFVGDAGGNSGVTESAFHVGKNGFDLIQRSVPQRLRAQGLGTTYEAFTNFLGFSDQESGKTMALAAYGDSSVFTVPIFDVGKDGQVSSRLRATHQWGVTDFAARECSNLGTMFPESTSERAACVAAYIQAEFVRALGDAVGSIARRERASSVCLSGGVALNCVANSHLRTQLANGAFYAFPLGSDCGLAVGNALYGHWALERTIPTPTNRSMLFGREYSDSEISRALQRHPDTVPVGRLRFGDLTFTRTLNFARDTAQLLASGAVVAWWQGRSEMGPRALGARSILADPRSEDVRERLNQKVKQREWFRPFGPAILRADSGLFVEDDRDYPYMIEAPLAQALAKETIRACVHVDGSTRVQTVGTTTSTMFLALLEELKASTGVGAVLNTSFNIREPIVETPADAIATFLSSSIDALVLGDYICLRSDAV